MEAQRCVKLSLTNRPFGLISFPARSGQSLRRNPKINPTPIANTLHDTKTVHGRFRQPSIFAQKRKIELVLRFDDPVVMAKAPTPDPIPNSVVKSFSANGTAS